MHIFKCNSFTIGWNMVHVVTKTLTSMAAIGFAALSLFDFYVYKTKFDLIISLVSLLFFVFWAIKIEQNQKISIDYGQLIYIGRNITMYIKNCCWCNRGKI